MVQLEDGIRTLPELCSPIESRTCRSYNHPDGGETTADALYRDRRVLQAETGLGPWVRLLASVCPPG